MPALMDVEQLQKLINNNDSDTVLIIGAVGWGLKAIEIASLEVQHVMNQKGEFHQNWLLPEEFSHNGKQRAITTADAFDPVLVRHVERLQSIDDVKSKSPAFGGLRPAAKFFRTDRNAAFPITSRKSGRLESQAVSDKLKRMIKKAGLDRDGITPESLRVSAAQFYYRAGMEVKDIQTYFGAKSLQTVYNWVKPEQVKVEQAQQQVFARINWGQK